MVVKHYDVIVVGSGSGAAIVDAALSHDMSVALVEKDQPGGTCPNVGCIPSKMLVAPADRVMEIEEARNMGLVASVERVDWPAIMGRMRDVRRENQEHMQDALNHAPSLDYYHGIAHFIDKATLEVDGTHLSGKTIYLVAGVRPSIPPIEGLDKVDYLTNENVFDLEEQPRSIIIVGGGYIASEFAHFFAAMGTRVTIVGRNTRLVPQEDTEVSELLKERLSERMLIHTHAEAIRVVRSGTELILTARDLDNCQTFEAHGEALLVAAGRTSNADLLEVEKAGVRVDRHGFIQVDKYLRTSNPNIWAFGDITGRHMYKHAANREAIYAWHNSQNEEKVAMHFGAMPSAVFTWPQIASIGLREKDIRPDQHVHIGRAYYADVAKGMAMGVQYGFAKALVDGKSGRILGFHIIGPEASTLIQEVINVMARRGTVEDIDAGLHIHPAMPELVLTALGNAMHIH